MYTQIPCKCTFDATKPIHITHSEKEQTDNNSKNAFIVYTISSESHAHTAKRRYSEFEAFRRSLVKLYPTLIVPPIPEKHSLTDYTTQKHKDDSLIIDKRKRMLERFLQRLAKHPILAKEHVFHRFLDGNVSWTEIRQSPPLSDLPKDMLLQASQHSFATSITNNLPTTSNTIIPIPSTSYNLKYPDTLFEASESKVDKTAQHATAGFEKSQKRILRRLGDLSNDYAELGSAYNALGLNETGTMATSIEKIGQVIDSSCKTTKHMVASLETEFAEHVQDYTQYLYIAKQVLRYRRMKMAQLELMEEAVDQKKAQLRSLAKTEDEAQKLQSDMDRLSVQQQQEDLVQRPVKVSMSSDEGSMIDTESIEDGFSAIIKSSELEQEEEAFSAKATQHAPYPTHAGASVMRASKKQTKRWSSPRKLFSAVTDTIQGMIDTDPGQTRRNQINKLREAIEQLEQARSTSRQELSDMSTSIQLELDRLQAQKESELKTILIAFAKIHVNYCEQNAASWKDIRNQVEVSMQDL